MQSFEVRVDVSEAVATGEDLTAAATVYVPERRPEAGNGTVAVFAYPGGGYNRRYYDLQIDGYSGYSQAEHHTARGLVFVACDHLGVGDSDVPTKTVDFVTVARANNTLAERITSGLGDGTLIDGLGPMPIATTIGIGQSFGGFTLTLGQAHAPFFDGVAMLGWSGVATIPPWAPGTDVAAMLSLLLGNGLDHPMRAVFHLPDVPDEIVAADMTKIPGTAGSAASWSTRYSPGGPALVDHRNPVVPGVVAPEAATIRVPVLVASGTTDVIGDAHAEAAAYRSSPDVTVAVFDGMAHMHNFATTRARLWDRLVSWYDSVAAMR